MKTKRILALILSFLLILSSFGTVAFADSAAVAKVGNTEYATIDEALANWTNNTTLTLLADVTLSDVIKLSSTEYHILDLGTYTMTAASKKDAIQIENNGRSSASYALDIKADVSNPGGITATGKAIVRTAGKSGVKDRPIIRFYDGVYNASYIVYHTGSNGTNCPQFQFHGGVFNGTIFTNRALNQFYGGTFNGSLMMSVDSSAYTLISGGTFKQLSNLYMSSLNSDKFTIGSAKGKYDREVYINDEGYYVVAAADPAESVEASVAKTPGTNDYLAYSKVASEGKLNYTDVGVALDKNTSATVTVYTDTVDLTNSKFKGTIVVPEGNDITIKVAEGTIPAWEVSGSDVTYIDADGNVLEKNDAGSFEEVSPSVDPTPSVKVDGNVEVEIQPVADTENAYEVTLADGAVWTEGDSVEMTFPAVENAADGDFAYVVHEHEDGKYIYVGKVVNGSITITNNVGFSTFTVSDGNLMDAFNVAEEGDTIILLADSTPVLTSQRAITKASIIDLGGNTLTLTDDDLYFGTTTFKNGKIVVDPSVNASTAVFWMFENQTLIFDNVEIIATGVTGTYLIGINGGTNSAVQLLNGSKITIDNDTAASLTAVICDNGTGNSITITDSELNIKNITGRAYLGGKQGNVTVEDSNIALNGVKEGFYLREGQTLSIEGASQVDITLNEDDEPRYGINLTDKTATYSKADTATVNASDNSSASAGISGSGTEGEPYLINNIDDLKWFRDDVNGGNNYAGQYVKLTADIDLKNEAWTPIGNSKVAFEGHFDGGDKTISNLSVTAVDADNSGKLDGDTGFFGVTKNGSVKNMTINNAIVTGRLNVGALAGTPYTSKYSNIKLTGHVEVTGMSYVGGLGGKNAYANWTDITIDVDNTSFVKATSTEDGTKYRTYVGGVIGFMGEGGHSLKNVSSNIKVIGDVKDIGGIVGIAHYGNTLENITFTGAVEAPEGAAEVGGIAGVWYNQVGNTVTFTNASSTGTVTVGEDVITGSIVGDAYNAQNETADTSGSLIIDGKEAWLAVAKIGDTKYVTLESAINSAADGDTITMLDDTAFDGELTLPADIVFNGNGKNISGSIVASGNVTFEGHTKVTNFNAGYNKPVITIGEGACLELTGTSRMVIGHGCTFNITGSITNAKTANTEELMASLIAPGASFTGAGVNFNVTNAYIKFTAYCSSKNSAANGTFNFNVINSIWEQTGSLVFSEPTESMDPTFNFNLKDSVLNSTSHLVFAVTKGEIVIDNSVVNKDAARQLENRSTLTIKNGSVVYASVQTSQNAINPGTTIVDNATYITTGEFSGTTVGTGSLILKNNATATVPKIGNATVALGVGCTLTCNTADLAITTDAGYEVKYENGVYTVVKGPVAKIGDKEYTSLESAINSAADGDTITLICGIEPSATIKVNKDITINLNGMAITGTDNATGNFALIEIQPGAELTIDDTSADKSGKITLIATNERNFNNYSSVISNQRGKLTVKSGTIEHLGGTKMAYGIDNLTNGKGTYAETVINGGTVKSTYRAIRQFLNGVEAQNILSVSGGTIEGDNKSIWMQQPNANANSGTLTVGAEASLYGDVLLSADEAATEYPVTLFIAAGALKNGATVVTGSAGLPEGYVIKETNGTFGVVEEKLQTQLGYVNGLTRNYNGTDYYQVYLFGGIDSLSYENVGCEVIFDGVKYPKVTKTVYTGVKAGNGDFAPTNFGDHCKYIIGIEVLFPKTEENADASFTYRVFATKHDGNTIYSDISTETKIYQQYTK